MTKQQVFLLVLGITVGGAMIAAGARTPDAAGVPATANSDRAGTDPGMKMEEPREGMMPMRGIMHRMAPDLVPAGVAPDSLPDPESRGAKLVVLYCRQCHNLPDPAMHSAAEWPAVAERMFHRTDRMSGTMGIESPSQKDRTAIVNYLKAHAVRAVPQASAPAEGSAGASLYKEFCTQCHAQPDPKSHTRSEWPAVVNKMQANMKAMNKKAMTADQEKEILDYLVKNAGTP
jgi:cytochrome c5